MKTNSLAFGISASQTFKRAPVLDGPHSRGRRRKGREEGALTGSLQPERLAGGLHGATQRQSPPLLENISPEKGIKSNFAYFSGSWAWPLFPLCPMHKAPGRVSYIQGKCTIRVVLL